MTTRSRRTRAFTAGLALLAVAVVPALQQLPATGADAVSALGVTSPVDPDALVTLGDSITQPFPEIVDALDADGEAIVAAPTSTQLSAAAALPAGTRLEWNDYGTPASIWTPSGLLAKGTGDTPRATARAWAVANHDLLGLSRADAAALDVVGDQPFADSAARAVLLRQRFGGLVPATGGMLTVGVGATGDVVYAASSLAKASGGPVETGRLTALQGWLAAAETVGKGARAADVRVIGGAEALAAAATGEWLELSVPGLAQTQQARLRAFVRPDGVVRPAVEANVVDTESGQAFAYRMVVDAVTSKVLFRQNAVENSNDALGPFTGTYSPTACGPVHPFATRDSQTQTIAMVAAAAVAADDITIKLFRITGGVPQQLGSYDLLTSPEAATYAPGGTIPQGTYGVQVCAFDTAQVGGPYSINVVTSDQAAGTTAATPQPRWRAFTANPALSTIASTTGANPDVSVVECWFKNTPGCSPGEVHQNLNDAAPWDQQGAVPTFTTIGNNANTHEAWGSFLTPGGLAQAPYSPTRDYTQAFTDVWNNSRCALTNFTPGGNDINAVTTGLFVGHNRIHDFSYSLGFTEPNYNLQTDNGGRGGTGRDPEIGNVQAGAATGGAAGMYMGRDNANQIALQDGVPGITNQYLFQPIAAAFYSPCTDGALDTGIYGHEYTHATSNRMVAGPDNGLTSEQGGAMGESWSDLVAAEYQFENDYLSDPRVAQNPWSLGSYTTGNFAKGIRDYAINDNPLNFSDYGFDTTGAEVHADGEIWNATMWEVRQALVNKHDAQFRYADKALQDKCADPTADVTDPQPGSTSCPGNRRWLQLMFDSFLMQGSATTMLQARDAMLAADQMRYGGANQAELLAAFARRGMGADARTSTPSGGGEDVTTPSFRSASGTNGVVTFSSTGQGNVYVGDYEARATPVAVTNGPAGANTAQFTPGIYSLTYVSATQGFRRFRMVVPATGGAMTVVVDDAARNVAAAANGATVIGTGSAGSLNAAFLIDGTEATNWSGTAYSTGTTPTNIDEPAAVTKPMVGVNLAGGLQTITSAKVSALLRPAPGAAAVPIIGLDGEVVTKVDADPLSGSRFTALRKFALEACTSACSATNATWTRFFTSADDAFPADIPRPVAPDQTMRSFSFAPVQAAAVRLVALENQCTGQARYAGEQDADPSNNTDCRTASARGQVVHAAELQVFAAPVPADPAAGVPGNGAPGSGDAGQGTSALPLPGQSVVPGLVLPGTSATRGVQRTKVRIRLPRVQQVFRKESTRLAFAVVAPATSQGRKAGRATIKIDGKKVRKTYGTQVTLKSGKKVVGKTYRIPRTLPLGRHTIQVFFRSSDTRAFTNAQSRRIVLTVVRSRPNAR